MDSIYSYSDSDADIEVVSSEYKLDEAYSPIKITVIGVGGGGGNAVNRMVDHNIIGVDFYTVNTDAQALRRSVVKNKVQIGLDTTKGLGAGANPQVGKAAAEESREEIKKMFNDTEMAFIAAGMGGGTGTGAAPIVAEVAKEMGKLSVAVVTKPFHFEGKKRMQNAEMGIAELSKHVNSLLVIPNEKLIKTFGSNYSVKDAFEKADEVLLKAVKGISDILTFPSAWNIDFNDIKTVMAVSGQAIMGMGEAEGEDRAQQAVQEAMAGPLLEDVDLSDAKGVLVHVLGPENMSIGELNSIGETVQACAATDAEVITGHGTDLSIGDKIRVTVLITGIGQNKSESRPMVNIQPQSAVNQAVNPTRPETKESTASANVADKSNSFVGGSAVPRAIDDEEVFDYREPAFFRNMAD